MASHHDHGHIIVEAGLEDGFINVAHHGVSVGVHWGLALGQRFTIRIRAQFDDGDSVVRHPIVHQVVWHWLELWPRSHNVATEVSHIKQTAFKMNPFV